MTAATVALPPIFSEDLPSGRVRVGFRIPGTRRKVQRTFDYAFEGEAWAEEARRRVLGAVMSAETADDVEAVVGDVLGRIPTPPAAPSFTAPTAGAPSPRLSKYARTWLDARRAGST